MGRPKKWTDEQRRAASDVLSKGGTSESAWLAMKRCGAIEKPTPSWFSALASAPPLVPKQSTTRGLALVPPRAGDAAQSPKGTDVAPAELLPLLAGQLEALRAMAQTAQDEGNIGGFSNVQRALNQTIALIDKLTPPAPPDPNDAPDMKLAAEQCRAKLHELLDKVIESQKEMP